MPEFLNVSFNQIDSLGSAALIWTNLGCNEWQSECDAGMTCGREDNAMVKSTCYFPEETPVPGV